MRNQDDARFGMSRPSLAPIQMSSGLARFIPTSCLQVAFQNVSFVPTASAYIYVAFVHFASSVPIRLFALILRALASLDTPFSAFAVPVTFVQSATPRLSSP